MSRGRGKTTKTMATRTRRAKGLLCLVLLLGVVLGPVQQVSAMSSRPHGIDPQFDCAMRRLAYEFARSIQPNRAAKVDGGRGLPTVFDGLELGQLCGDEYDIDDDESLMATMNNVDMNKVSAKASRILSEEKNDDDEEKGSAATASATLIVDAMNGCDEFGSGLSVDSPVRTIHRAIDISREMDSSSSNNKKTMIHLRNNAIHYIDNVVQLDERDNGLIIETYPGDMMADGNANGKGGDGSTMATISAGLPLHGLQWKPAKLAHLKDRKMDDGKTTPRVFVTDIPPPPAKNMKVDLQDIPGIHTPTGRLHMSRYPNTPNPFVMNDDWNGDRRIPGNKATYLPPKPYDDRHNNTSKQIHITNPKRNDVISNFFDTYRVGVGGACEIYDPPVSYWCADHVQGGAAERFHLPTGMILNETFLPYLSQYTSEGTKHAVVNIWRVGRWANWMFETSYDIQTKTLHFTKGGFQGARGNKVGQEWYIENVLEELDDTHEYYFDREDRKLYVVLNTTTTSSSSENYFEGTEGEETTPEDLGLLVVPYHEGIFNVSGSSPDTLVKGIQLKNMILTGTRSTYLTAPHTPPSGGDWSLERRGAIFLENTQDITISDNLIDKIDGHGVMISGKNLRTSVSDNEIRWVGGSAIVSWGRTDGEIDERGFTANLRLYPDGNVIERNLIHEVGHYEKQNSFYMQAKTARSIIRHNIMFNGPRAGINYNDGFTGGDWMEGNLVFNACRESGDHGPFNSWDRQPYITPGSPDGGIGMDWRVITKNFFVANYESQEAIDNDDGSAYYNVTENFFVYSTNGMKSDFGGHDIRHEKNIYALTSSCMWISPQIEGHEDYFRYNRCIVAKGKNDKKGGAYGSFSDDGSKPRLGHNEIYAWKGSTAKDIKMKGMPLDEFHAKFPGLDPGTTFKEYVPADVVMGWARDMLMPTTAGHVAA